MSLNLKDGILKAVKEAKDFDDAVTESKTPRFRKPTVPPQYNPPPMPQVKPPKRGYRIRINPIDDVCDINIVDIIELFKSHQFICSMCGNIVSPEIEANQDNTINMITETGELRGGIGNKVLKDRICKKCIRNLSCIAKGG